MRLLALTLALPLIGCRVGGEEKPPEQPPLVQKYELQKLYTQASNLQVQFKALQDEIKKREGELAAFCASKQATLQPVNNEWTCVKPEKKK